MCDAGCCWRPRATACPSRPNIAAAETLSDGAQAAPGATESPVIHHSTTTERLGNMLAMCLSRGHPTASTCTTPPHSLGSMEVRHHRLGGLASGGASERGGGSLGPGRRDQRWRGGGHHRPRRNISAVVLEGWGSEGIGLRVRGGTASRSAKQQGEARREGPTPLADFGDRAWPRHPIAAFNQDWTTKQLWNIMTELAWCLVDYATVKFNGKAACQIAVPLLDPLPGYESPNYATSTSWSAAPGAPLLTGFVLCV